MTRIRAYRFSPHIANDPAERCARFIQGLNFDIQSNMANHPPVTHAEALDVARRSENIANRKKAAIALSTRRAAPTAPAAHIQSSARPQALRPNQTTAFKGPSSSAAPPAFGARPQVTCFHCKKPGHTQKECKTYLNLCFNCGKAGHRAYDCPEKKVAAPGRQVFTMEAEHVADMEGVITG